MEFHLYKVQEQTKPAYDDRGQDRGYIWQKLLMGRGHRGTSLDIRNICHLDSSTNDSSVQWVKTELCGVEERAPFSLTP